MKHLVVQRRNTAFTLIELLVVIAIISILAGILFPVFARARENARRASCLSNLKQINLGILQYTQDYDELYPLYRVALFNTRYSDNPYGWSEALQPYIKSTQLFQCPSEATSPDPTKLPGEDDSYFSDYAYNLWLGGFFIRASDNGGDKGAGLSLSALTVPSQTVILSDFRSRGSANHLGEAFIANRKVIFSNLTNRHLGGLNFAFADGHAKWYGKSSHDTSFRNLWEAGTPGSVSKGDPTLNPTPDSDTSILTR